MHRIATAVNAIVSAHIHSTVKVTAMHISLSVLVQSLPHVYLLADILRRNFYVHFAVVGWL